MSWTAALEQAAATNIPSTADAERQSLSRNRNRALLFGAFAGGLLSVILVAFFVGFTSLDNQDALVLEGANTPSLVVTSGALYFLWLVVSGIGALVIAALTYGIGREAQPDTSRFPLRYVLPAAVGLGALIAYAVLKAGIGLGGDISGGVVTISAYRFVATAAVAGLAAGGAVAMATDMLTRPSVLRLEGEAWPTSRKDVLADMMRAIGGPTISAVVGLVLVVVLSQVLLSLGGAGAVIVFSLAGALFLGGATLVALRPWDRQEQDES